MLLFLLSAAFTCIVVLLTPVQSAPLSLCPSGWNETDYRCYMLLSSTAMKYSEADDACTQLGVGARVAYPADYYELNMIGAVAAGYTVWLGYRGDGTTFKTFYNAIGFPNQFVDTPNTDTCGLYRNQGSLSSPSYGLASQACTQTAQVICQISYCSPVTAPLNELWVEYKLRCFLLVTSPMTFAAAQSYCAGRSASLAIPTTQEENDYIMRIFPNNKQRWVAVKSDYDGSGLISWTDATTGAAPTATFWPTSVAPSTNNNNNTCVYMSGSSGNGWQTAGCSNPKAFICKRVMGSLSFTNCSSGVYGKYTSWTADCILSPGSQTRRWRKCISMCNPSGCAQVTAKYCQYQPKWATWGPWGGCSKPTKGSFQMVSTPCLFNGERTRSRLCLCGTDACGGCGSPGDSAGATQSANCNIYISKLCPSQECTYCSTQFSNSHCYEDGSPDSLTNNFRCVCNLGYLRSSSDVVGTVPMGCSYADTSSDDVKTAVDCSCAFPYDECQNDYNSCTSEQLCQYPTGGPHTCYCKPGYRMIPSGGCVAASRIPPQCKIVSGSSFLKNKRGEPLIPYSRGYICTCGESQALIDAGYSTRNSTTGEEAAARIVSRNERYMCYCFRATVKQFLRLDPVTNLPVETKFNLTRQFMYSFPECEMGYYDNMTHPKIPADLFTDVDIKLADLEKRTYFKCTGAEGFNSRFEYLTQPVLGEALSPPLEEPGSEYEALLRLLSVDEAAIDLFQSMLSPDCETQRSYLSYIDVMSGTEVFLGNVSDKDTVPTFVEMQCGNWSFPPEAVDRSQYPGAYQPLIAHCYPNATKFKSNLYNSTSALANQTTLDRFIKQAMKIKGLTFTYAGDEYNLPAVMINSGVMSISTNPEILKFPADIYLNIWFPLYQPPAGFYKPHCTFYDFGYVNGPTWRTKVGESGCSTKYFNSTNGIGYVQCKCNHMTIFSVTMVEVIPTSYYLALIVLNAIVVGGSALSILCLALTLLIYIQLRRFSTERIGIMLLCFAIGMTQALLLAGAKLTVSPTTCRIISILLHFFGLLTFSLVASQSLAMYFRFVSKFRKGWQNMGAYYMLGFAIPTVTVVVTAGGFFSSYGVGYSCWMDLDGFIKWAFFVPFMVVGVLALYLLIKIAPVLYKVKGTAIKSFSQAEVYGVEFKYGVQKKEKIEVIFDVSKKKFWGLIVLLCILTLTWVLGILSMQYESVYYDYGFAIFNASQGFFIFIMFCIREEEVRILCCAGCMSKQQPAGKITWLKFVDIYERYFALVLHNEEQEKRHMTFQEFVSQEYSTGALMPQDIVQMDSREYVSAQRGLVKPNYLLTCSCCFPAKTAPMPMNMEAGFAPPAMDLTQKLFVVGPDGELMCLDKDGGNAAEIIQEIGSQRPGSVAAVTGSAPPRRPSAPGHSGRQMASSAKPPQPVGAPQPGPGPIPAPVPENAAGWVPPPTLFPEFPDSDEEGDVAADIAAEVKINRDMLPKAEAAPPPQRVPSARPVSARQYEDEGDEPAAEEPDEAPEEEERGEDEYPSAEVGEDDERPKSSTSRAPSAVSRAPSAKSRAPSAVSRAPSAVSRVASARPTSSTSMRPSSAARPGSSTFRPSSPAEDDEGEAASDRPTSAARPGSSMFRPSSGAVREDADDSRPSSAARPGSSMFRPSSGVKAEERPNSSSNRPDSSAFRPSSSNSEAGSKPKGSKKATSELNPLDLDD